MDLRSKQRVRLDLPWRARLAAGLLSFVTLGLAGCAAHRARVDFTGFEKAFADTSNHELLLNLARLQNHDPTYFFKMGQITSSYRMQANITTNGAYVVQGNTQGASNVTGGGSPGLVYESDPQFQFIPVNDETNAQLLLKPIPAGTFYILYQQGWRFDQLFRLMIDRLEVTESTDKGCTVTTYRNTPPPTVLRNGVAVVSGNPADLSTYVSFLRISAVMYGLQRRGHLLLRGVSNFVPLDKNAGPFLDPAKDRQFVTADTVEKAAEKSSTWEQTPDGRWQIGQRVVSPRFYLAPPRGKDDKPIGSPNQANGSASPSDKGSGTYDPDVDGIEQDLLQDPGLSQLKTGMALRHVLEALHNGLAIESDANQSVATEIPCPIGTKQTSSHLVMRSLIGVMAAAAQEQRSFEALERGNPTIPILPGDTEALQFRQAVPTTELQPMLRLQWRDGVGGKPTPPLTEVEYRGGVYLIADSVVPRTPENEFWNRDMFRLINALTSQVTVDISKFPIPDILNLRTQ